MSVEAASASIVLLPFGEDPLQHLARHLLERHAAQLPDLTYATVLIADAQLAPALRRHLLAEAARRGHTALLGPKVVTLREWLEQFPLQQQVIGQYGRELMLIEALRTHQGLFGEASLWTLADALLELFDELTLNQVGLPDNLLHFQRRVARAYGYTEESGLGHSALQMETRLVHTLWHAWHTQLHDSKQIDSATATLLRLRASLDAPHPAPLYLLDPCGRSRAELEWLRNLLERQQALLFIQGELSASDSRPGYLPDRWLEELQHHLPNVDIVARATTPLNQLLHQVYDTSELPMRERTGTFLCRYATSPLSGTLEIFTADSAEQEARAVETQVRLWLLEGLREIGIVTENRRLARRVRALLERANIHINDAAGWALSTTSAAAVLERWLECVEEDFPWRPLLDLLKSPFFSGTDEEVRNAHLTTVYRLEQEIIHTDNIGSGLARYRARILERQQLLAQQGSGNYQSMVALLDQLESAAKWLRPCFTEDNLDAARIIDLLQASLREVGLVSALGSDDAGMRLLDELQQMRAAAGEHRYPMQWQEFRSWLGRSLERYNFRPLVTGQTVHLMSLAQSAMQSFDAVILAAAEQEHLPGGGNVSPFFNDQVRRELGLNTREDHLARRFQLFRHLPEAASNVLITHRGEENGEEVVVSPWLELLTAFHRLAWGEPPGATLLRQMVESSASEVTLRDAPLPRAENRPAPVLPATRLPQHLSASSYQQLIDCPYLFFAAQGLRLAPSESIREALEKADYGEKVHRCLQAFHDGIDNLPGPFAQPLSLTNRDAAITMLREIAEEEFLAHAGSRFENRAWLKRWQELIPSYIDWQIERAREWRIVRHEELCERNDILETTTLRGRLDRIEQGAAGMALVDYKTGRVATEAEIVAGESVQLPFYALLSESDSRQVAQVEFLRMDEGKVTSPVVLQGDALAELREATRERIAALYQQMRSGNPLPAWGDEQTCSRCTMDGLCRRQMWPL